MLHPQFRIFGTETKQGKFAVYLHLIIFDTRFRISYFELNLTCLPLRFFNGVTRGDKVSIATV